MCRPTGRNQPRARVIFAGWGLAGKIDDLQSAQHHAGRGAPKHGEERKILQIDDGERDRVDSCAHFAERELAAERAEERQKTTVRKSRQAASINAATLRSSMEATG